MTGRRGTRDAGSRGGTGAPQGVSSGNTDDHHSSQFMQGRQASLRLSAWASLFQHKTIIRVPKYVSILGMLCFKDANKQISTVFYSFPLQ